MSKSKLAIFGGNPVRTKPFPSQNTMDENEINAVINVMKNGRLSGYRANWDKEFFGGPKIQELEEAFKKKFNVKYAIPCNSATSGLHIACGAVGLGKNDECIVTPYSMTCSATAPMIWNAKPVFVDVEKDYYCLDPDDVERKITDKTKAIIAVSIFGQPYDVRINQIAKKHGLMVIEDAAQAIGSAYYLEPEGYSGMSLANYAGTLGDIGIFSFNYGKHLTCGEGGVILTNNDALALKCRLIMNHSEAVVNDIISKKPDSDIAFLISSWKNKVGFNMRMTELQAAIIIEQLKKFNKLLHQRRNNVQVLCSYLEMIPAITFSPTRPDCTHSYYCCTFQWDATKADGLHRDTFIKAVKAELPPRIHRESEDVQVGCGYIKPIPFMPLFNQKEGQWPICENLWKNKLFLTLYHAPMSTTNDCQDVVEAFQKVWKYRNELRK